jgi:hypothetical protein
MLQSTAIAMLVAATACPFCSAPQPSLAERRDSADVVLLAEVIREGEEKPTLRVHRALRGPVPDSAQLSSNADLGDLAAGQLLLVFLTTDAKGENLTTIIPVDETSAIYVARAPSTKLPEAQRLPYFARYLEHADNLIADDAYAEFGRAPLEAVRQVVGQVPMSSVRAWLTDDRVPQSRKGLYGLLAGLAVDSEDRRANAEVLESIIAAPSSDFRAGFDGVLGGYLLLEGKRGLQQLERRYVANVDAPRGDVLHFLTSLRFYAEYGHEISVPRLARAIRPLLNRPEFAAAVIIDLGRWEDWDAVSSIATLFDRPGYEDAAIQRAIVGFLLVCPTPEAKTALAELRQRRPQRVAELEATALLFTSGR